MTLRTSRALVAAAALADTLTFLLMGTASEANPIAAIAPVLSVLLKAALAGVLLLWPWRYATQLRAIGAVAWAIGAATNIHAMGVL